MIICIVLLGVTACSPKEKPIPVLPILTNPIYIENYTDPNVTKASVEENLSLLLNDSVASDNIINDSLTEYEDISMLDLGLAELDAMKEITIN